MSKLDPAHQEATVMASELKPCPFCGSNQLSFRSTPDMDTDGKFHRISCNECGAGLREKFAMETCPLFYEELRNAWNTRPAPAATDTGLVTVGVQYAHEHSITGRAMWGWQKEWKGCAAIGTRELVTRSQAEELLAAERARYVEASQRATNEESLKDTMHRGLLRWKERAEKAEADNAAKDARIKDAETGRDRVKKIFKRNTQKRFEAESRSKILEAEVTAVRETLIDEQSHRLSLEAKLAAAEKALEFYADASKWDDGYFKSEDDGTVLRAYPSSVDKDQGDKARAVLGGKPS